MIITAKDIAIIVVVLDNIEHHPTVVASVNITTITNISSVNKDIIGFSIIGDVMFLIL